MFKSKVVLLLVFSLDLYETAKILAWFPVPSLSHQVVFRPITQELAKRGHQLIVITPDPAFPKDQAPENLTEIDVHDISYEKWSKSFMNKQRQMTDDVVQQTEMIAQGLIAAFDAQLNTTEMRDIINGTHKFDLVMIEACTTSALAISEVFKVPVVQISSFGAISGQLDAFGAPVHPFLYPVPFRKRTYNVTIWEKIQQLYMMWEMNSWKSKFNRPVQKMISRHYGLNVPQVEDLMRNVDLILLNEHPLWAANRPVPPNVVYMGGVHQKPKKDLPKDLRSYLDTSKHGVIYISFGTNVDPTVLPKQTIQTFIKVFSELPYDVLWKWNQDQLPGRSQNIKIYKWLPQADLLRHPNIKLFITQGGLQSTDEAITAAVPVIGIPFIADQWQNTEQYVQHGVGLQLEIKTLSEETLRHSIETVIGDASYRKHMVKLRDLINDQPLSPLERAVWWTEHVLRLRHGGARHLRAPAANVGWAEYYELKLVSIILGVLLVFFLLSVIVVSYVMQRVKSFLSRENLRQRNFR